MGNIPSSPLCSRNGREFRNLILYSNMSPVSFQIFLIFLFLFWTGTVREIQKHSPITSVWVYESWGSWTQFLAVSTYSVGAAEVDAAVLTLTSFCSHKSKWFSNFPFGKQLLFLEILGRKNHLYGEVKVSWRSSEERKFSVGPGFQLS